MKERIPFYQVDAFTEELFGGNPAAVLLTSTDSDPKWMLNVAKEMNLSETAFVYPQGEIFHLRWFTPQTEVDLCGHATLSAAHVLWESQRVPADQSIQFQTRSGILHAKSLDGWIELDFPCHQLLEQPIDLALLKAVGGEVVFSGISGETNLLEYASEGEIRELKPDFDALLRLPGRGVIVTSRSDTLGFDFVSRYFAPWIGINEDPVTGSSHTILAPYWGKRLHKREMIARQISNRSGVLRVRLDGERVGIQGKAVTVMEGVFYTC